MGTDEEKKVLYDRIASSSPQELHPLLHLIDDSAGRKEFKWEARSDDVRFFCLLVEKGATHGDPNQRTNLMMAACISTEIVRYMLQNSKYDINAQDFQGSTALHYSIWNTTAAVELLLLQGADPHIQSQRGTTPFLEGAMRGDIKTAALLLEYGADLHASDRAGKNAMHHAASHGFVPFVKWLLDIGCQDMMWNKARHGTTPLDLAIKQKRERVIDQILQFYGQKVAAQEGDSSLHWILRTVVYEDGQMILEVGTLAVGHMIMLLTLLVSNHPSLISAVDDEGALPLHIACQNRKTPIDVFQFLVKQYLTSVRHADKRGNLPIHLLCSTQPPLGVMLSVLTLFVSVHPNQISTADGTGALPVHIACRYGGTPIDVIQFLVEQDLTTLHYRDNQGNLPIHTLCASHPPSNDMLTLLTLFISIHPNLLWLVDGTGALPLHISCQNQDTPFEVIQFLVGQAPAALLYGEYQGGNLPIHTLCAAPCLRVDRVLAPLTLFFAVQPDLLSTVNGAGALPIHTACQNRDTPCEVIQFLVEHDPTTLHRTDNQGNLPIHTLCAAPPTLISVKYVLGRHEAFISTLNSQGHAPFMVACLVSAPVDVLWYLMTSNPGIALASLAGVGGHHHRSAQPLSSSQHLLLLVPPVKKLLLHERLAVVVVFCFSTATTVADFVVRVHLRRRRHM